MKPADRMCPLKARDEIFIDEPDSELNDKIKFQFEIAIKEPSIVEDEAVLEMVRQMYASVSTVVTSFRALFS